MLDMKKILRSIFGKDLAEMNNRELSDKIDEIKASHKPEKTLSLDELAGIPMEQWGTHDVGAVRFVPAAGIEPCELCSVVSGKCLDLVNARFYLDHVTKNHRVPLCLVAVPAYRVPGGHGCALPEMPKDSSSEMPGYQVFHRWAESVYNRDAAPPEEE